MSGLPWDDQFVKRNLEVIASLRVGDKLSVLKGGVVPTDPTYRNLGKGGRGLREIFDRQKGGSWKKHQAKERAKKGETLLDDRQYKFPLANLFSKAISLYTTSSHAVERNTILSAFMGMGRLRQTYLSSGNAYKWKINEIISDIEPLIPRGSKERFIILKGKKKIDLFQSVELYSLNKRFCEFLDASGNTGHSNEQVAPNEELVKIFDTDKPSDALPTTIPTNSSHPSYSRQNFGVCECFWLDHSRGGTQHLEKTKLKNRYEGVKELFDALDKDEAMLFVVSQLACQAGIECAVNNLLNFRTPYNYKRYNRFKEKLEKKTGVAEWLFLYPGIKINQQAVKISPMAFKAHPLYITVGTNFVEVSSVMSIDVNNAAAFLFCELLKDENDPTTKIGFTSGVKDGIKEFSTSFTMKLRRRNNKIRMALVKAEITFRGKG